MKIDQSKQIEGGNKRVSYQWRIFLLKEQVKSTGKTKERAVRVKYYNQRGML